MIQVLDHGYVAVVNIYGNELDIVNAARLSYNNHSTDLFERDIKLLKFLVREIHTSPLRHVYLSLEFNAPLFVARQHWRHVVGASTIETGTPFSELSRRYVRGEEEYYVPHVWRSAPENSKQGSGDEVGEKISSDLEEVLKEHINISQSLYENAVEAGVAPEQARLFLPAYAMYTKYLWTPSLHAALNFIELRSESDSQWEIQEYSRAVEKIIKLAFPNVYSAWCDKSR